jgi:hypothetical protein
MPHRIGASARTFPRHFDPTEDRPQALSLPSRELRGHLVIRNGGLELLLGIGVLDVRPVASATSD